MIDLEEHLVELFGQAPVWERARDDDGRPHGWHPGRPTLGSAPNRPVSPWGTFAPTRAQVVVERRLCACRDCPGRAGRARLYCRRHAGLELPRLEAERWRARNRPCSFEGCPRRARCVRGATLCRQHAQRARRGTKRAKVTVCQWPGGCDRPKRRVMAARYCEVHAQLRASERWKRKDWRRRKGPCAVPGCKAPKRNVRGARLCAIHAGLVSRWPARLGSRDPGGIPEVDGRDPSDSSGSDHT